MRTLKRNFIGSLHDLYSPSEAEELFFITMEHLLCLDKTHVILALSDPADEEVSARVSDILCELKEGKPIQYILGTAEFMGNQFSVNQSVLIPRPETSLAVETALEKARLLLALKPQIRILDIGTGSGIIAVTLKLALGEKAIVEAVDISEDALMVAKGNAENLRADVSFKQIDILSPQRDSLGIYDVIVSNPPYIRPSEKADMRVNVLDYEPHLALFIPETDPLLFYKEITNFALSNLETNGHVVFEINEAFGSETKEMMLSKNFCHVEILKDFYEKDRIVVGSL